MYDVSVFLFCLHVRLTLHQICDYPTKMRIGVIPTEIYGNSHQLCPYWEKTPGPINVFHTTHYRCQECEELAKTGKPLANTSRPVSAMPQPQPGLVRQGTKSGATGSNRGASRPGRSHRNAGPPTSSHPIFDGTSKSSKRDRPHAPGRVDSKFKEDLPQANGYVDMGLPLAPSSLTSAHTPREQIVKELQEEMRRQKTLEEHLKKKLEPGDKRIKALMAALHDEQKMDYAR